MTITFWFFDSHHHHFQPNGTYISSSFRLFVYFFSIRSYLLMSRKKILLQIYIDSWWQIIICFSLRKINKNIHINWSIIGFLKCILWSLKINCFQVNPQKAIIMIDASMSKISITSIKIKGPLFIYLRMIKLILVQFSLFLFGVFNSQFVFLLLKSFLQLFVNITVFKFFLWLSRTLITYSLILKCLSWRKLQNHVDSTICKVNDIFCVFFSSWKSKLSIDRIWWKT